MSGWDIALIAAVSIMGTAVAYLRHPERKAFVLMLPIPFSLAFLAVGRPLDATNVLAMAPMFGFTLGVWGLHARARLPIVPSIALGLTGYVAAGIALARLTPPGDAAFWSATVALGLLALALIRWLPYRPEPHHRTPLPLWIKLPAIALVVTGVVLLKRQLGGATTMFPMVGVVTAYEARHSLWTMVRRLSWVMLIMTPVMALMRLVQEPLGALGALALGWVLLLALLWTLRTRYHKGDSAAAFKLSDPADRSDPPDFPVSVQQRSTQP